MSQFAFLQPEWPDVFEAAAKAEALAFPDPRTACFYARRDHLAEPGTLFPTLHPAPPSAAGWRVGREACLRSASDALLSACVEVVKEKIEI